MFARIVAKCMTKGGIGVFAPTAITTMNFVTRIKMAIANFAPVPSPVGMPCVALTTSIT
jgi:hypothetical protein